MKILVVSHRVPYPLKDGGVIAMHALLQGLKTAGVQVKLLCLNPKKDGVDAANLPQYFYDDFGFEYFDIDTDIKAVDAFLNLFTNKSYHMVRFYNEGFAQLLAKTLQADAYDVIHLESLFVTGYLPVMRQNFKGAIAMRAHNVEHQIWQKLAVNEGNPLKRWYLNLLARRLKNYEIKTLGELDAFISLTKEDADFFEQNGFKGKAHVSPHGIDLTQFENQGQAENNHKVFHLGSMDWIPNQEAMRWFLDEVWTLVLQEVPQAQFHLAGKKIPQWVHDRKDTNVHIEGEVPDAIAFMQGKNIMVVPLLSGSGIRIKILEGMALGKAIVSTPLGAAGINCTHDKNILIGETPAELAAQLIILLNDNAKRSIIGQNARQLIEDRYDNNLVCKEVVEFYKTL
jgi:glycosyltransferase involved in cell wall biosynthesis